MGNACSGKNQMDKNQISEPEQLDLQTLKRSEVAKHNTPEDCWVIIDNIVYNLTEYQRVHPGGSEYVQRWAGKDATLAFREFNHSSFAEMQLKSLGAEVGVIDDSLEKFNKSYFEETPIKSSTADIEENFKEQDDMMCYQCQQTMNGTGCTDVGVCGKNPTIAALQDLIVHYLKGMSQYLVVVDQKHWDDEVCDAFLYGFFMTLTNVNFNENKHWGFLDKVASLRDKLRAIYEKEATKKDAYLTDPASPSAFIHKKEDKKYLFAESRKVGINSRKVHLNPDLLGLLEMCVYGMKGGAAYMYHAEGIRNSSVEKNTIYDEASRKEVFKQLFETTAALAKQNPTMEELIALNMAVGKANFSVMDMLDVGHNTVFGQPSPSLVNRAPIEGKCILISGHDMVVLKDLLIQTEGTGINVYTHGEMLPAFGYPELRKYKHLAGNFGSAWYNQTNEFPDFPGAILLNSNCLIQPQPSYAKRIFTTHIVGWDDIKHIEGKDYSEVISCALKLGGFKKNTRQFKKYENEQSEMTGYGHATMVELLVPEIQAGNLTEIYLVGGCDNLDPTRSKYLQQILELPKTAIVLTLGCAKFRLFGHKEEMGYLPGDGKVPRLIDVGQCNDAYSAVKVALALTKVLNCGVNELPLHLVLSWVEQKAVVILLTLLHLGIQNINLGPNLPAYVTPAILNFLIENFKISAMQAPRQESKLLNFIPEKTVKFDKPVKMFSEIQDFQPIKLVSRTEIAQNTYEMNFEFMNKESEYCLKSGQHVLLRAKSVNSKWVSRAYTPITLPGNKGDFKFILKVYEQGLFSNFLKNLEIGQFVEVQGPCGSTLFAQNLVKQQYSLKSDKKMIDNVKSINMISGGTSCVSMFQIIQEIVLNKFDDKIKVNLIVANSRANLKVLEREFTQLKNNCKQNAENININYITSDVEGRISKEIFERKLDFQQQEGLVSLIAGPHNFRSIAGGLLKELGQKEENIIEFF